MAISLSFLSKFGSAISKGLQVINPFLPTIGAAASLIPGAGPIVGTVLAELPQFANIIMNVEAIGQQQGIKGADKLKMATPLVAQAVLASSLVAGHKIANSELFNQGCGKLAEGVADVLNSLDADSLKTVDRTQTSK